MYLSYFGLTEPPFSIAPDPRYLYMSQRHQEALAHLLYGVKAGGGFVLLTGEVGAGKTTVCRCLLEQIPESCDVAYVFNPKQTVLELLSSICKELHIVCPFGNSSAKVFVDCINDYLLTAHAKGRHTVLIIDEAQNLSADVLEQMRLLTNLETSQHKLLQIILLGQPELAEMLVRPELRQLAQRIIARYHLDPLAKNEVAAYVQHRLAVSGTQKQLFPNALMPLLHRLSGGIPRLINVLCDRALLGAYVQNKERVTRAILQQAAREVLPPADKPQGKLWLVFFLLVLTGATVFIATYPPVHMPAVKPIAVVNPVPTKPVPVLPVVAASLEWPASVATVRSRELAYASLFAAWGGEYQRGDECLQASTLGLGCLVTRGGLLELRQLNLPAVLRIHSPSGQEFYAALLQLDNQYATFSVGAEKKTVALSTLAEQWSGDYTLLWRMPPRAHKKIRKGDYGSDVNWLSAQLAQINGTTTDSSNNVVYDDAMMNQVKAFQVVQGLTPDGTAGYQTIIRLSHATDASMPKLFSESRRK